MNTKNFLNDAHIYFRGAYEQFAKFGGPALYFHAECILASENAWLSHRHIEMLYATLTAWGMHRMGNADSTKTRLTRWERFAASVAKLGHLSELRSCGLLEMDERHFSGVVQSLRPAYEALDLTESGATIVVNAKALSHLFPQLIPPIDRQHTVRFFKLKPEAWRDARGKFRTVTLPVGIEAQFDLFHEICVKIKRLTDQVEHALFEDELRHHRVPPPKAIDNAIVNYVRLISRAREEDYTAT